MCGGRCNGEPVTAWRGTAKDGRATISYAPCGYLRRQGWTNRYQQVAFA